MPGTVSSGIVCFLFLLVLTGIPVNGYDNSGFSAKHSAQRAEKCMGLNSHLRRHRSPHICRIGHAHFDHPPNRTCVTRTSHGSAVPGMGEFPSTAAPAAVAVHWPSVCADRRRQAENGTAAPLSRNARMLPQAGGLPRRSRPDSRRAQDPVPWSSMHRTARDRAHSRAWTLKTSRCTG